MQEFPDIDRTLIEEHIRLGYSEDEITEMIKAFELNASTAGIEPDDPKWAPRINRALAATLQRFQDAFENGQYHALVNIGYRQSEIHTIFFTNLLPTKQLLTRTVSARKSGEYR